MLKSTLDQLSVNFRAGLEKDLGRFIDHLLLFNRRINLVSRKLTREDLEQHILSSIAPVVLGLPETADLLDIGSGGGFPAIPLLIAQPDWRGVLVEATGKKCLFLRDALETLAPGRGEVLNERYEESSLGGRRFNIVTVRAVRMEPKLARRIASNLAPNGYTIIYAPLEESVHPAIVEDLRTAGLREVRVERVEIAKTTLIVARA